MTLRERRDWQAGQYQLMLLCLLTGAMVGDVFFGPELTPSAKYPGLVEAGGTWRVR